MSKLAQNTHALVREKYGSVGARLQPDADRPVGSSTTSTARRTRTANRAVVVLLLRCNKRNFTGPTSLQRPVGTKTEFERLVAPNLQKAIAMWRLDARWSHFCDVFIDGDGAAGIITASRAGIDTSLCFARQDRAIPRARTGALVNAAPWRRECAITGLHGFV
jgi:hypothetical protein